MYIYSYKNVYAVLHPETPLYRGFCIVKKSENLRRRVKRYDTESVLIFNME